MPRRKPTAFETQVEGSESYIEPPALTPDGRDQQLTSLAYRLVEQRLRDGTASAQETVHFLRLATRETRLKEEKLRHETALLESKKDEIDHARQQDVDYKNVIKHLRRYQGLEDD